MAVEANNKVNKRLYPTWTEILEVLNGERAAYRVRRSDGRESILYPGSDVFVEHYPRRGRGRT